MAENFQRGLKWLHPDIVKAVDFQDLSTAKPDRIDQLWSPILQRAQYEFLKAEFYERQLQAGKPVTVEAMQRMQGLLASSGRQQAPFLAEWDRRGGWSRFWVSPDGIVHNDFQCQSFPAEIEPQMLPGLSGWSKQQVVEHAKLDVCLQCFDLAKQSKEWQKAKQEKARQEKCAGSARKPKADKGRSLCSVCGSKAQLSDAGRVKAHPSGHKSEPEDLNAFYAGLAQEFYN